MMFTKTIAVFWVPGLAETKGSWVGLPGGRMKRDNPRELAWSHAVGWSARAAMRDVKPTTELVAVWCVFYLPPTHGKKGERDADKLARSALDAMSGIVYADDKLVSKLLVDRYYGTDESGIMTANLGARIMVWPADDVTFRPVESI